MRVATQILRVNLFVAGARHRTGESARILRQAGLMIACAATSLAVPPPHFETDIQPLLQSKCAACHSAKVRQGGLSIESREDLIKGGKTGGAVVPGKPMESVLLSMVSSGRMPMGGTRL